MAATVTVVPYAHDLSKPQADFSLAVVALLATGFALMTTFSAWARRKNLKKIDRAGKMAAAVAGPADRAASRTDDWDQGPVAG